MSSRKRAFAWPLPPNKLKSPPRRRHNPSPNPPLRKKLSLSPKLLKKHLPRKSPQPRNRKLQRRLPLKSKPPKSPPKLPKLPKLLLRLSSKRKLRRRESRGLVVTTMEMSVASRMTAVVVVATATAEASVADVVETATSSTTKTDSKPNKAVSKEVIEEAEDVVVEKAVVEATTKEAASAKTMARVAAPFKQEVAEEDVAVTTGLALPSNRMRTTTKRRWQVNRSEAQVRKPEQAYLRQHLNKKNKLKSDTH